MLQKDSPADTRHSPNVFLMLAQRRRRLPNIKTTLSERLVLAGGSIDVQIHSPWHFPAQDNPYHVGLSCLANDPRTNMDRYSYVSHDYCQTRSNDIDVAPDHMT